MEKLTVKNVIKVLLALLVIGATVYGLLTLDKAANAAAVEREPWVADAHTKESSRWEVAAENDRFRLSFNPGETILMVEDKANGTVYRSNPEQAEDAVAFGQNKSLARALLDVTYVDNQSASYTVNSAMGSTQNGTYSYRYADQGVYVNFQFEQQEFEIPCYFGITEDRFVAKILGSQIVQHGDLRIANVSLLPFFGAGTREEDGYLVVPDGSGALIRFNNQKQSYMSYAQSVYGRNLSQNLQTSLQVTQSAMLPVFGISKDSGSLLAVITNGASQAEIRADVSGKITANNTAYSAIYFIQAENNTLLSGSDNEAVSTMLSRQFTDFDYEVSYFPLEGGADYAQMAQRYRQYLVDEKGMAAEDSSGQKPVNLHFVGGMMARKTFLGVPYRAVEKLTGFSDVAELSLALQEQTGSDFCVTMQDTLNGGSQSKMPTSLSFASALGGKGGYQKMADQLESAGLDFYGIYDPVTLKDTGKGYSTLDATRNVSRSAARQYDYLLSSGARDKNAAAQYLLTPDQVGGVTEKLLASAQREGVSKLGLTGISNKMYGDYRQEMVVPLQTEHYFVQALQQLAQGTDSLLLDAAYGYALPYADGISNVPLYSSQFDVEDEEIPFYQMVMGGTAELYAAPINDCGNVRQAFLRCVEYGVSPAFRLMARESSALQSTDYQHYYAISYADWADQIVQLSQELPEAVLGVRLTGHETRGEGLSVSTFADGSKIYVNYTSKSVSMDGITVPAEGFARKGG